MHRNIFGDPRPKGIGEIDEALIEMGLPDNDDINISILFNSEGDKDGRFYGFSAEFDIFVDDDVKEFSTLGYLDCDELKSDLDYFGFRYENNFDQDIVKNTGHMQFKHKTPCS